MLLFSTLLIVAHINFPVQVTAEEKYLSIPALGRTAQLGFLYNFPTDTFRDVNIFRQSISKEFIIDSKKYHKETKAGFINTYSDKFRLLNIDGHTSSSILAGLLQAEGATDFVNEENKSKNDVVGVLLVKFQTTDESLQVYYDALKPFFNTEILSHKEATHVVTGITWGAEVAVTFKGSAQNSNSELASLSEIKDSMEMEFDYFKGTRRPINTTDETSYNFSVSANCDILLPQGHEFPVNQSGVQELLRSVHESLNGTADGKGVPLKFRLTPLKDLKNYLQLPTETSAASQHATLNESMLQIFVETFDDAGQVSQELNDLSTQIEGCSDFQLLANKVQDLQTNFGKSLANFKLTFATTLQEYRKGIVVNPGAALADLPRRYYEEEFSPENVRRQIIEIKVNLTNISHCSNSAFIPKEVKFSLEKEVKELRDTQHELVKTVRSVTEFLKMSANGSTFSYNDVSSSSVAPPGSDSETLPEGLVPLYRYWDAGRRDHFYTTNWDTLENGTMGFVYEKVECLVFGSNTTGTIPLHRYYHNGRYDHYYTTNYTELGAAKGGFVYQRIQCYIYPTNSVCGTVPLYRYFHAGNFDHFYTINYSAVISGVGGWMSQGIVGYVFPSE